MKAAQRAIGADEFAEWQAYDEIEPFGEDRADLRIAMMASSICNLLKSSKSRPFKVADFMAFRTPVPAAVETVTAKLMAWAGDYEKRKR